MKWIFLGLLTAHGLIHLIGFARTFGPGEFGGIARPLTGSVGLLWLAAAVAMFATAVMLTMGHRSWWLAGLGAVLLSQGLIASAWGDAKFGTLMNLVILAGVIYGFAFQGPMSFRSRYLEEMRGRRIGAVSAPVVTQGDLVHLPEPVRCYVRNSGALGQPRVQHFRSTWKGRIRQFACDPWMEFTAEQTNFIEGSALFFIMKARKGVLPVDVFHAVDGGGASMQVRFLSLVPLVDPWGPEADRAETVTIFNDMGLLAPDSLLDPSIRFEPIDEHTTRAWYTRGEHTISALLSFNDRCELVNFISGDRLAAVGSDGGFVRMPFSTQVGEYREVGLRRIMTRGEARWHPPEGEYVSLQMELAGYAVNGPGP